MFPTFCLLHSVSPEYVAGKRATGHCITWRCKRVSRKEGARCEVCSSRLHRYRHPDHYVFVGLKASARKRSIKFELTFAEFRTFIAGSDYMTKKGTEPHSLTIDRRFTDQPYRLDNLRFLSHADNSSHKFEEVSSEAEAEAPW